MSASGETTKSDGSQAPIRNDPLWAERLWTDYHYSAEHFWKLANRFTIGIIAFLGFPIFQAKYLSGQSHTEYIWLFPIMAFLLNVVATWSLLATTARFIPRGEAYRKLIVELDSNLADTFNLPSLYKCSVAKVVAWCFFVFFTVLCGIEFLVLWGRC